MRPGFIRRSGLISLAIVLPVALHEPVAAGVPQEGGFMYQGVLRQNGTPYNGTADFEFRLFDASAGGAQVGPTLADTQAIADGTSNTLLLFEQPPPAPAIWDGNERWLEVRVRTPAGSANPFVTLSPRQKIASTPYAAYALNATLGGAYGNAVSFTNAGNTFTGAFAGSGAGLTNLNAGAIGGLIPSANIGGTYANALTLSNTSNAFAGAFTGTHSGNGAALTSLNASNIATGTLANARTTGTAANTPNTLVLRDGSGNFSAGTITGSHAGSGAALTNLNASNIASGTLSESRLPSSLLDRIPSLTGSAALAGSIGLGAGGNCVVAANGFAYVVTTTPNTLQVFDLSAPIEPALRGSIATTGNVDLEVESGFAYVVNSGLDLVQIFNVSNPDAPALAGSFATSTQPIGIDVVGNFAYVVSIVQSRLEIFNISNPASVSLVGTLPIAGNPVAIVVSGGLAYIAMNTGNALQIVNVGNPAAPVAMGSAPAGSAPRAVALAGSTVYIANSSGDTITAFNVSNPASPSAVGTVAAGDQPFDLQVVGNTLCVANNDSHSVQYFDISAPASPALMTTVATNVEPRQVSIFNGYTYVVTVASKSLQVIAPDGVSFADDSPIVGSGLGLTSLNANSISVGVIANAFTSGTASSTADTLMLRDSAGGFAASSARLGIGSAAAPALSFENDIDTGIFRSAVDTLAFATGGTERLRINNLGNVGIGTTAPTRTLHVVGTAAVTGDVGIGTTTPGARLHVQEGSAGSINPSLSSSLVLERSSNNFLHMYAPDASESGILFGGDTADIRGGILFNSTALDGLAFRTGGNTSRMVISSAGDVGIGATAPLANLHVRGPADLGSLLIAPANSNSDSQVFLAEQNSTTFGMILRYDGAANLFHVLAQQSGVETAPLLTIERSTAGLIGMGRTPASNKLEVEGNASKTTSGSWLANSDARIKTQIEPVAGALETLDRIRLASFRYTPEYLRAHPSIEDRRYLNVIAQEFAQVFPEHVKGSGEFLPGGAGEEILQVDIHPLTIYSAAAIQELHREMNAMRSEKDVEIASLRDRIAHLELLVEQMLQKESH